MRRRAKGLIHICGLGVNPAGETTLETLGVLGSCRVVLTDLSEESSVSWLRRYCPKLVTAANAKDVMEEALSGGEVGLAVWGHPQFSSVLARQVEADARVRGLEYKTWAAISPVGSAFARSVSFLGGEYGYQGIQAYDASLLLQRPELLQERLPLVVYAEKADAGTWGKLARWLSSRYPAGHPATVFHEGSSAQMALSRLEEAGSPCVVLIAPAKTRE